MGLVVEGKLFKVAGTTSGGGNDPHNKGWFATQAALEAAYATAEAGDYAIVGSTDTVWVWDTDTSAWVDSDQKGQVESVNGRTGAVTVSEVPSQTGYSGCVLGTDGFVAGWIKPERVQRSVMPVANEDEANNIYEYVGTTDANYTNGYFYKCVSDGQEPATYSWIAVEVQASSGGLPDQTGQSGKFLTTNGTTASWGTVESLPSQTGNAGRFLTTDGTDASWSDSVNIPFNRVLSSINETLYSVKYNNDEKVTASYLGSDGVLSFSIKGVGNNYVGLQYRATDNQRYIRPSNNNLTTLGDSNRKWANVYTNKLNNGADIAVPNATGTMAVISVNTTVTLAVADWSSSTQTITVSGVKADSVVFVSPAPASASDYASAGILCTAQAADSLTFTCDTTPTNAITVNIVCL